ncbi:MAG: hypothetical protein KJ904_12345 [Alphaproteobacteria bacterium]|nr:hypothetical protein [Alphaproteobacteria bacterium]MBU0797984.1 hypothetical protein [Alphaproteobacteria bacterium]MBU0887944.1 hypothetical protein [Alphaproteobacteria bacterium]MBU1814833.1 hypothetical protein [Alphaproteobacteria bacterium]
MEREIDRFYAVSKDGESYLVVEHEKIIEFNALGSPRTQYFGGSRRLALVDGSPVNQISNTEFEILDSGERIQKIEK